MPKFQRSSSGIRVQRIQLERGRRIYRGCFDDKYHGGFSVFFCNPIRTSFPRPCWINSPTRVFELVFAQYVSNLLLSRYLVVDHGLQISFWLLYRNPSYQYFTFSKFSDNPNLSNACITSSSVKPKEDTYLSEVAVTTSRLLISEKMDSLLILVMPVRRALSRQSLVVKVVLKRLLINTLGSCQYP